MRRFFAVLSLMLAFSTSAPAQTVYVSPDVPTDPSLGLSFLPWEWVEHKPAGFIGVTMAIPGNPQVDALHKLDAPGNWLFSIEAPSDLGGALASIAEPRDVIRLSVATYSLFFCGGSVSGAVPLSSNVDAVYLDSTLGDLGDLLVSFDAPTTISGTTFDPADIVRYTRTASPGGCGDWALVGIEFDASAVGTIASGVNVIGADKIGGKTVLAFDVPADLLPSVPANPYLPGKLASWDGTSFDVFLPLTSWPFRSQVDALSCQANPGQITAQILIPSQTEADMTIQCPASCSSGAESYGLYEGTLDSLRTGVYDHRALFCGFVCPASLSFTYFDLGTESTYYLMVPYNSEEEGSYGVNSSGVQRPQAANPLNRCAAAQNLSPCP